LIKNRARFRDIATRYFPKMLNEAGSFRAHDDKSGRFC
jgi:hypothetical protein